MRWPLGTSPHRNALTAGTWGQAVLPHPRRTLGGLWGPACIVPRLGSATGRATRGKILGSASAMVVARGGVERSVMDGWPAVKLPVERVGNTPPRVLCVVRPLRRDASPPVRLLKLALRRHLALFLFYAWPAFGDEAGERWVAAPYYLTHGDAAGPTRWFEAMDLLDIEEALVQHVQWTRCAVPRSSAWPRVAYVKSINVAPRPCPAPPETFPSILDGWMIPPLAGRILESSAREVRSLVQSLLELEPEPEDRHILRGYESQSYPGDPRTGVKWTADDLLIGATYPWWLFVTFSDLNALQELEEKAMAGGWRPAGGKLYPGEWYERRTNGKLNAEALRMAYSRGRIDGQKIGGRNHYELESVCRYRPAHEPALRAPE